MLNPKEKMVVASLIMAIDVYRKATGPQVIRLGSTETMAEYEARLIRSTLALDLAVDDARELV